MASEVVIRSGGAGGESEGVAAKVVSSSRGARGARV